MVTKGSKNRTGPKAQLLHPCLAGLTKTPPMERDCKSGRPLLVQSQPLRKNGSCVETTSSMRNAGGGQSVASPIRQRCDLSLLAIQSSFAGNNSANAGLTRVFCNEDNESLHCKGDSQAKLADRTLATPANTSVSIQLIGMHLTQISRFISTGSSWKSIILVPAPSSQRPFKNGKPLPDISLSTLVVKWADVWLQVVQPTAISSSEG